jgi:hypothetical protein
MTMNPFYNHAQHRLRAFWRLLIQAVLFLLGILILGFAIGLASVGVLLATGQITADVTGEPAAFSSVIAQIYGLPLIGLLTALVTLLAMWLTCWLAARFLDRRRFKDFGFHFNVTWWRDLGFGLVLGALLMVLIFVVEWAVGWVTITGTLQSQDPNVPFGVGIVEGLIVFVCVGIYEELFSRGYQLRNLAEGLNFDSVGSRGALSLGYLFSSSAFGLLHLGNPSSSPISTFNLSLAGLFLGLGFVLTGELAIPIGLHITWNFFQGRVFGFPVSGLTSSLSFVAIQQGGPTLWTGGAFGPEAGLLGLLAMLLGSALIVGWVRRTRGQVVWQTRLAQYLSPGLEVVPPVAHAGPIITTEGDTVITSGD